VVAKLNQLEARRLAEISDDEANETPVSEESSGSERPSGSSIACPVGHDQREE
jgi:hypothetical protein